MQKNIDDIKLLLIISTILLLLLISFIITMLYLYYQKQIIYQTSLEKLKLDYEKSILNAQLEMQEQTFQHISREIHDNISLSLTLAKLNLNTISLTDSSNINSLINTSIEQIGKSIDSLRDLSKGLNSDLIVSLGLTKVLDEELRRIKSMGIFDLNYSMNGNPVFMDSQKELIIFRIIQEALNNVIKHARASKVDLNLNFNHENLEILIADNGKGFCRNELDLQPENNSKSGLLNIHKRTQMLNGLTIIDSEPGRGTTISVTIPY